MKLLLKNFRSHKKLEVNLGAVTVIVGSNGSGKTNILEAVSFLSAARSFRADDKRNLIREKADFASIKLGDFETVIARLPRLTATFKIRGVKKRIYDFVGQLPSVIFTPESLNIITGSPADRRRFMDGLLSQISGKYFKALVEYKKIIHQRNHLLAMIADGQASPGELDFWDRQLSDTAEIIIAERELFADFLKVELPKYYQLFSKKNERVTVDYKKQAERPIIDKLVEKRGLEIAARTTIYGPHRDNLIFLINDYEAENYASRGELRSLVLSLKLAEIHYLDKMRGKSAPNQRSNQPLLLLDDVYSELDQHHREQIRALVTSYPTVITTTDLDHLSKDLADSAELVKLDQLD
jgi:DNA replication and repair protein RecF